MKEIVKVLLQEGIDEETIHEVLDILEGRNLRDVVWRQAPDNISLAQFNDLLDRAGEVRGSAGDTIYKKGREFTIGKEKVKTKNQKGHAATDRRRLDSLYKKLDSAERAKDKHNN